MKSVHSCDKSCCYSDRAFCRVFGTIRFSRYYCSEALLPVEHVSVSAQNIFKGCYCFKLDGLTLVK